jgi:pimeloyl-ACP methyl ester carboxylesterase
MTSYVLVHGAHGGGWMWTDVVSLLRAKGHDAFPVTLTGLGERSHLATPEVNLSTHIEDVINVIRFEDLTNMVLVGHSYGGMVITGVADRMPESVAHLVYVDAQLPEDGQSAADLNRVTPSDEDWLIQPPLPPPEAQSSLGWEKLTPQPRATLVERLHLSKPIENQAFSRTFIKATKGVRRDTGPGSGSWRAADRVRASSAWTYHEIDTGHLVQAEKPAELAELLLSLH